MLDYPRLEIEGDTGSTPSMPMSRAQYLRLAAELDKEYGVDRSIIVADAGNGWTIRLCTTYGDICREGELMSNCWGRRYWTRYGYGERQADGTYKIIAYQTDFSGKIEHHSSKGRDINGYLYLSANPNYKKRIRPRYFSLRDPDNLPRVSFYVGPNDFNYVWEAGEAHTMYGRHNATPKDDHREKIKRCQPIVVPILN